MKVTLFSTTVAAALLGLTVSVSASAQASPEASVLLAQQASAPQIDQFTVKPVDRLAPGTELVFTLEGTPSAKASLTIGGIARNLPMREVEPGVYEGRYTIRSQDQLSDTTVVRANLAVDNRISSVRLQQPLTSSTAANNSNNSSGQTSQSLYIDRFTAQPVQSLEPGTVLSFTLVGTPNASATFSIEGVATNQPLREGSPGTYRGEYVIRRQDNFSTTGTNVTAALQANGQQVRARLDQALTGSNSSTSQLPIEIISPQNNSQVSGSVEVRGRSAPNTTLNVNVRAATSLAGIVGLDRTIFKQQVQTDAQGNFRFTFKPSIVVPGTRYEVSLNATNGSQTRDETLVLIQK